VKTVEFHHGMSDKLGYACRLVRKAQRSGVRLVVSGDAATLKALDRQLWVFDDQEFVPHVLVSPAEPVPAHLRATPVWLVPYDCADQAPDTADGTPPVLINVGSEMPAHPGTYARLFEVVSSAPEDRQAGRQRWKLYNGLGLSIQPHEVQT